MSRLDDSVSIETYELEFSPDLKAHTFRGRGKYAVTTTAAVSTLVLHCADLAILEVAVGGQPASFVLCPEEERLKVSVDLRTGASVELALTWSGELNDRLVGFYRSTYTAMEGGESRVLATTQFEACDARRAFPCLDEPARRSVVVISLVVPPGCLGLSNMNVASEVLGALQPYECDPPCNPMYLGFSPMYLGCNPM